MVISKKDILESFKLKEELGLDNSYIQHPYRDNFFIQRVLLGDWIYCESNSYARDIYGTWTSLEKLIEMLIVIQKAS